MKCPDKNVYYSLSKAERIADKHNALQEPILYAYRCPDCGFFHLTKKNPKHFTAKTRRLLAVAVWQEYFSKGEHIMYEVREYESEQLKEIWEAYVETETHVVFLPTGGGKPYVMERTDDGAIGGGG